MRYSRGVLIISTIFLSSCSLINCSVIFKHLNSSSIKLYDIILSSFISDFNVTYIQRWLRGEQWVLLYVFRLFVCFFGVEWGPGERVHMHTCVTRICGNIILVTWMSLNVITVLEIHVHSIKSYCSSLPVSYSDIILHLIWRRWKHKNSICIMQYCTIYR